MTYSILRTAFNSCSFVSHITFHHITIIISFWSRWINSWIYRFISTVKSFTPTLSRAMTCKKTRWFSLRSHSCCCIHISHSSPFSPLRRAWTWIAIYNKMGTIVFFWIALFSNISSTINLIWSHGIIRIWNCLDFMLIKLIDLSWFYNYCIKNWSIFSNV